MRVRLLGVLAAMLALISAALATGTRIYYAVFFALGMMILFSLISVLWTLFTVRVTMKSGRSRAMRGEKLMAQINVRHGALLPAGSVRIALSVPGGTPQEIAVDTPPLKAFDEIVKREPYPVENKAKEIVERLKNGGITRFLLLFRGSRSRSELVATFMAVLELCSNRIIKLVGGTEDCAVSCQEDMPKEIN